MNARINKIARLSLGFILIYFGLNKFFNFLDIYFINQRTQELISTLANTGFFFEFLGGIIIIVGIFLILNRFVPLALIVLAPFSLGLVLFHIFYDMSNCTFSFVIFVLNVYLIYDNWEKFQILLSDK